MLTLSWCYLMRLFRHDYVSSLFSGGPPVEYGGSSLIVSFEMLCVATTAIYQQLLTIINERKIQLPTDNCEHIKKTDTSLLMKVKTTPRLIVYGKYLDGDT